MRRLVALSVVTGALALMFTASIAQATPASGVAGKFTPTVQSSSLVDQVHWRRHHHRHWRWHRHHRGWRWRHHHRRWWWRHHWWGWRHHYYRHYW